MVTTREKSTRLFQRVTIDIENKYYRTLIIQVKYYRTLSFSILLTSHCKLFCYTGLPARRRPLVRKRNENLVNPIVPKGIIKI